MRPRSEIDAGEELELGFDLVRGFPNDNALVARVVDRQQLPGEAQPFSRQLAHRERVGMAIFVQRRRKATRAVRV